MEANNLTGLIPICCTGQLAGRLEGQRVGAAMSCAECYQNAAFPICLSLVCLPWSSRSEAKHCSRRDLNTELRERSRALGGREERSQQAPVESAAVTEKREVKKGRGGKKKKKP